jgi:hypothetical protein
MFSRSRRQIDRAESRSRRGGRGFKSPLPDSEVSASEAVEPWASWTVTFTVPISWRHFLRPREHRSCKFLQP